MTNNKFIPIEYITSITEEYLTKRISVKLVSGEIVTGNVAWHCEDDFEEETGVECDWGFVLDNAEVNGISLGYSLTIPESRIISYLPLEPANTEEELKKLFGDNYKIQ